MKKPILIETKIKFSTLVVLLLAGFGFCFLSYILTSKSLQREVPQILEIVIMLSIGAFGLYAFISLWKLNSYHFDGEYLRVKSIFKTTKKVIGLTELKKYTEIEKENKWGKKWKELTLFTDTQQVTVSSKDIANYEPLKSALTMCLTRDEHAEMRWVHNWIKRSGIAFIIFGALLSVRMLVNYSKRDVKIQPQELNELTATIAKTPEFEQLPYSTKRIEFRLKEYPSFVFSISGIRFLAANSNAITTELKANDQIELDIFKDVFEKKIGKTEALDFIDKCLNYHVINVNGLRKEGKTYLRLENINKEHKRDSSGNGFWRFLIIGIETILIGMFLVKIQK